nr:PREDICTED: uncharacterized protein LOC108213719 [Daucus carota subsp. sativus]
MRMMNFATLRGLSQSSRSILQKRVVLGSSGSHEFIVKAGYAKLKKKYGINSNRKCSESRSTPENREENYTDDQAVNCTNDQVANCTNEQANCTSEQVVNCSSYQAEEFRGEDFCGEDFCGEVFSGGEEFHGEDFDREEFEGDKIFRSVEFTTRVPISSKTATRVDDFVSFIFNNAHQDEEK